MENGVQGGHVATRARQRSLAFSSVFGTRGGSCGCPDALQLALRFSALDFADESGPLDGKAVLSERASRSTSRRYVRSAKPEVSEKRALIGKVVAHEQGP